MESRRLHLAVAARLRGITYGYEHRHSYVSERIIADYLEAMVLFEAKKADFMAQSSTLSHPDIDLNKAASAMTGLYYDMLGVLGYFNKGKTGAEYVEDERMQAVKEFLEWRKQIFKDESEITVEDTKELEIKSVDKL